MIDLGLEGARAIVVGAGYIPARAGHGRGSALNLAKAGATVACVDMDEGRAKGIVAEIEALGGKAIPIVGDVMVRQDVPRIIGEAVDALGGVDVCVDVVGEAKFDTSIDVPYEDWDWQIEKNLTQNFSVYKAVAPHMIRQGTGGAIVSIASVDGFSSSALHVAYGAAKAGLLSIVKSFSEELGPYGIRVNAVAPGNVGGGNWDDPPVPFGQDPVNPLQPPKPQDIANAVLFLCSSLAARITGQCLTVDGGATTRSPWGFKADQVASLNRELPKPGPAS